FADRLGRNNSSRFAHFHKLAGREVASVTHSADASPAFASQDRPDFQAFHTNSLQVRRNFFVDQLIRFDDLLFLVDRVRDRFTADAPNNSLGKIDNFLVALINRAHDDSIYGAAIFQVGNDVLCSVDQFARKIAGVRGFYRGVGQTFTSAVSRDEIFEYA